MAVLQEKTHELSIVMLNYHTDEYTLKLLDTLPPRKGMEIIIVDNSLHQGLEEKLPKRDDIMYIFSGKNFGFAGGNNQGIQKAHGEWIMLLNNDTLSNTRDLFRLIEITKEAGHLVSTPRLINSDGTWQQSVGYFDPHQKNIVNHLFARPRYLDKDVKKKCEIDFAHFTAILLHRSVFKTVGLLDDSTYFMYFEDIDFCQEMKKKNISILYVPEITLTHFGGASSDLDKKQKNINYTTSLRRYLEKHRGSLISDLNSVAKILK